MPNSSEKVFQMSEIPRGDESELNAEPTKLEDDRISVAGPVWQLKNQPTKLLSPVSEIALTLNVTSIATPTTTKQKTSRVGEFELLASCCALL